MCSPMRTGRSSSWNDRCSDTAHSSALRAEGNASRKPSPWFFSSIPPWSITHLRTCSLCRLSTRIQRMSPSSSVIDVEPSMSVTSSVTVPSGARLPFAVGLAAAAGRDVHDDEGDEGAVGGAGGPRSGPLGGGGLRPEPLGDGGERTLRRLARLLDRLELRLLDRLVDVTTRVAPRVVHA